MQKVTLRLLTYAFVDSQKISNFSSYLPYWDYSLFRDSDTVHKDCVLLDGLKREEVVVRLFGSRGGGSLVQARGEAMGSCAQLRRMLLPKAWTKAGPHCALSARHSLRDQVSLRWEDDTCWYYHCLALSFFVAKDIRIECWLFCFQMFDIEQNLVCFVWHLLCFEILLWIPVSIIW